MCMIKRTTIEIDEDLLARAKKALGCDTARATVDEALRRAAKEAEDEFAERRQKQLEYLRDLHLYADMDVLASEEMWR